MEIRPLGIDDYEAIFELWKRSGLSSIRPSGRDSRESFASQMRFEASAADGRGFQMALGLKTGDELIGVIVVTHDGRKGWLNRLAIDPNHRRQGHAHRLIAAGEELLRKLDIHVIGALVERENEASLRLF